MKQESYQHIVHPFPPVFDRNSRILILGSLPSVKSREVFFYYGHPQNRFWKVIAALFQEEVPESISQKKDLLLRHEIALWDVIQSCDIIGSSDSSIRNAVPNDFGTLISHSRISRVFTNGGTADRLYRRFCYPVTNISSVCLPSTSPANAAWSLERLISTWKEKILPY